jgi:phospholipid/cholesterol/gamma-HCH transport system permease protein
MGQQGLSRGERLLADAPGYSRLESAGAMGRLFVASARVAVKPPFSWWGECLSEMAIVLRRCLVPAMISITAFAVGLVAVYVAGIISVLGTTDRIGGGSNIGFIREPSIWVTTMILAGVAGSAMTADLGARKVRGELDALLVLGIPHYRALIVPRIVALTLAGPILSLLVLLTASIASYVATMLKFGDALSSAAYIETFKAFVVSGDLINNIVKCALSGLLIGVVSCYKGLTTSGGAEGVGRAVNQAVLITFFGVWTINVVANTVFLSLFPTVQILRG